MTDEKIVRTLCCTNCGVKIRVFWREGLSFPDCVVNGLTLGTTPGAMDCCDNPHQTIVTDERVDGIVMMWNEERE